MSKQIITLCAIIVLCCLLTSCGLSSALDMNFDLYGKVQRIKEGEDYILTYQGAKYYGVEQDIFNIVEQGSHNNDDVMLGWKFNFPFTATICYYSDTLENPVYVYANAGGGSVYFREDYDYKSDIFILEGTESSIEFSKVLTETKFDYDVLKRYQSSTDIVLYSEAYPKLRVTLKIFQKDGVWYARTYTIDAYEITNEFLTLLIESQIIVP